MPKLSKHTPYAYVGSEPYETLIVCHNSEHQRVVREAFEVPGVYTMFGQIHNRRFKTVIAFRPQSLGPRERQYFHEYLPTVLLPEGRLYLV